MVAVQSTQLAFGPSQFFSFFCEDPGAAPLVRKPPSGADRFTQLGGAFLVLLAVMAAPSFSGQMACVAASVVGYQLRALQAFFGPSNCPPSPVA